MSSSGTESAHAQGYLLPQLYATEQHYGWSIGMRAITHSLLADVKLPAGPILEIGCGGGALLAELTTWYPGRACFGMDLHPLSFAYTRRTLGERGHLTQANLHHLPFVDNHFSLLLALDVFDQQQVDLNQGLRESRRLLAEHGYLLLRVSAYSWLQGAHDVAFNTGHRYDMPALLATLRDAHFEIVRITYANTLLAAPAIVVRLLERWRLLDLQTAVYRSSWTNRLLATALQWESTWLRRYNLPLGLSLWVAARKQS